MGDKRTRLRDKTRRTRASRSARKRAPSPVINDTEAHFRIIVDAIPTAAWTALPDGSNEFVNQR